MKFAAYAVGIAALMSTSAMAADLSVAPYLPAYVAPAASAFNWTGFYAGLHGGLVKGQDNMDQALTPQFAPPEAFGGKSYDPSGGFIGIHAGYLYQLDNNLVLGIEGDWDWTNATGHLGVAVPNYPFVLEGASRLNSMASLRARLGYAMDHTLVYATAGVAFADYDFSYGLSMNGMSMGGPFDESFKATGLTVGAGVSQAFTDNIAGYVEYRFSDFGSHKFEAAMMGGGTLAGQMDLKTHALQTGLSLKF